MSRLRLGRRPDGTRHVVVLGPARARPAGYGGQAIGSSLAPTVLTHAQRKARGTATEDAAKRHRRSV